MGGFKDKVIREHLTLAVTALWLCLLADAFPQSNARPIPRQERPFVSQPAPSHSLEIADLDSAALDSFILNYMDLHHIPGLSAAVVKESDVIWSGAYGNAYFEPFVPVSDSTLFMLASVSKTITGTALMQLYDEGLLDLDDPINDYLPFEVVHPQFPNTDITFQMLLTHSSGIQDNWFVMPYYPGDSPIPLGEYLENYLTPGGSIYSARLNFTGWEPGTGFSYCNNAVALAGYLVEVISGMPFEDYCEENIFEPLDMYETAWFLADLDSMHVAMPYYWNGNTYTPYGHFGYSDYPSGQLRTSALQLMRFLTAFMQYGQIGGVRILDSTTVALMTTPQIPQIDPSQGLIWYTFNFNGRQLWGHGGGDLGVTTEMYYCPEENSGVIILTNGESFIWDVLQALFDYAELYDAFLIVNLTPHNPPIQIPAGGGSFGYDVMIINDDTSDVSFDVWINASLPNGAIFGPILLRQDLTLSVGDTLRREDLAQEVPAGAPPGEYSYIACVGAYPGVVIASGSFNFSKLPVDLGSNNYSVWTINGWDQAETIQASHPSSCALLAVYPNPFNAQTRITYTLPQAGHIELNIFDVSGRVIARLTEGWRVAGTYEATFNGEALSSGIYFVKFESADYMQTRKLLLLK